MVPAAHLHIKFGLSKWPRLPGRGVRSGAAQTWGTHRPVELDTRGRSVAFGLFTSLGPTPLAAGPRPDNAVRLVDRPVNLRGLSQGWGSPAPRPPSTSSSQPLSWRRWGCAAAPEPGLAVTLSLDLGLDGESGALSLKALILR